MTPNVVFIRKMRRTRHTWAYLSDHSKGTMEAPDGDLFIQLGTIVDSMMKLNGNDITVICPQLTQPLLIDLRVLYPTVHFMPIVESSINQFFDRAFTVEAAPRRRMNPNTVYIGADASGGHMANDGSNRMVPAAWAWCSDGVQGSYDVGFSGFVNVNVSEFEGIMNAIIANADSPANRLHVYSDSANAVDMFNFDLAEGIIPREARKYGLVDLASEAMAVVRNRNVTVEWVKGHRQHRLNMIADSLSRHARKRFSAGMGTREFVRETDALYAVFNRNA